MPDPIMPGRKTSITGLCLALALQVWGVSGLPGAPGSTLLAKAYFASRREMVERSRVIVLVDIGREVKANTKAGHWTYSKIADAKILKVYKKPDGDKAIEPNKRISIIAGENFICAQTGLVAGTAIAFLNETDGYYHGSNWSFSLMPVKDGKVPWIADPNGREQVETPLNVAESELARDIKGLKAQAKQ